MADPDFRICRPADDSDEGVLAAVSEPLWPLRVGFVDQDKDPKKIALFCRPAERWSEANSCRSQLPRGIWQLSRRAMTDAIR